MTTDDTSKDEPAVTEQSGTSLIVLSSDEILTVIEQLHACYDYCAAWKEPVHEEDREKEQEDRAGVPGIQR